MHADHLLMHQGDGRYFRPYTYYGPPHFCAHLGLLIAMNNSRTQMITLQYLYPRLDMIPYAPI